MSILPDLNLNILKKLSYIGWGTTIAILDSGIDGHWVVDHHDFTGYGSTPKLDHGTKVANIVKSVARGSQIKSFKVCHDPSIKLTNVLNAIDSAVTKADILNLSLGFDQRCSKELPCVLCEVVNYYTQHKNKLFVVAAGNYGGEGSIVCPGNAQESITVGAIDTNSKKVAPYSSKGNIGEKKPNIITSGGIWFNNQFDEGTSYATPVITGVSAATYSVIGKNISKLKSYLYSTTIDIGEQKHHQGFGKFNLKKFSEVVQSDESDRKAKKQR